MTGSRYPAPTPPRPAARAGRATSTASQLVVGVFCVALVAVLSLPQARSVGAELGWVPFWLLALPASAWLALQARRMSTPAARMPAPVLAPRRQGSLPASRRRVVSGARGTRRAHAA